MSDNESPARDPVFEARIVRQAMLEWLASASPMDRVLSETLREHKVGANQRGPISKAVYELVRFWPLLVEQPANPQNPKWLRTLDERVKFLLTDKKYDLLEMHAKADPGFEKDPIKHIRKWHAVPEFLIAGISAAPAPWHTYLHQMYDEATVTVRLNPLKGDAAEFAERYAAYGARASAWVPNAFYFDKRWPITQDEGFKAGHFEIQDEHSQLISLIANPRPDETVLDMCAGAGGKSLHLAALMGGKGEVVAYDIAKRKLTELMMRARRAGLTNVRVVEALPARQKFDVVVVDAPCSGLGTLRRTPDRLYRFTEDEGKKLSSLQFDLLRRAREYLKPGGRLVYATCTVRPEENLMILKRVSSGAPLNPLDIREAVKRALGAKADAFLTLAAATPASKILPTGDALSKACLQVGPSSQTSGGLVGDGFFVSLVN